MRWRWIIVVLLFLLYVINYADKSIIGYAAVPMMEELHLTPVQWGVVGSSFFWSFVIMNIFGGALSDRFGPKKILCILAAAWTVIQFGTSFASSLTILILSRVVLGVFEGPFYAAAVSQISNWFPKESRSTAISLMQSGSSVGAFVSAPVLVFIIQNHGWRMAFNFLALLSLIMLVIFAWLGRDKPKVTSEENRAKIQTTEQKLILPKVTWSSLPSMFLNRTFILCCFVGFSGYWFTSWATVWMPTYLLKVVHLSPTQMGNASLAIGLLSILVLVGVSKYTDVLFKKYNDYRKAHVRVSAIGLIIAGLFSFSLMIFHNPVWAIISLLFLKGMASTCIALGVQIVYNLLPERGGLMSGTFVALLTTAGIIGPIVSGWLLELAGKDEILGFNYNVLITASLLFVAGILHMLFTKPQMSSQGIVQSKETLKSNEA
ncbi:MFS transporter [Peribacillus sp. NPDC060186]